MGYEHELRYYKSHAAPSMSALDGCLPAKVRIIPICMRHQRQRRKSGRASRAHRAGCDKVKLGPRAFPLMGTRAHESQDNDRYAGRRQAGQARPQPNGRALPKRGSVDFPVVALGASAGGLDAFKKFFDALPANCGMAFVLIQHLDPNAPEPDGRSAGRPHADDSSAGDRRDAARARPRVSHSSGRLFGNRGTAPSGSPSPWSAMARACPSTSSCARWPKNAVSAPSARSSRGPAPTAVSD